MSLRTWREMFESVLDNLREGILVVDRKQRLRLWNDPAKRLLGSSALEVGGQVPCRGLRLCDPANEVSPCTDACPIAFTLADGKPRETVAYLRDASGRRIPARICTEALRSRTGSVVGAIASVFEATTSSWALARISELEELAYVDPLTEVANRRFTELQLRRSLGELLRFQWGFGVVVLDVDGLKLVNDLHGHRVGDTVLRTVAHTLSSNSRPFDIVGRWGGDEFLVVVKNVGEEQLEFVAHKLSAAVERASLPAGEERLRISVSAGAAVATAEDTADSVVARADQRMYQTKGRARATGQRREPHAAERGRRSRRARSTFSARSRRPRLTFA
jgi:diguanylate cyclase (GGDEF)-like protein/PAS domain S-box-containing protein